MVEALARGLWCTRRWRLRERGMHEVRSGALIPLEDTAAESVVKICIGRSQRNPREAVVVVGV